MASLTDVLVVEDEPVVREAARRILRDDQLTVSLAGTVEEAVAALEAGRFRLVLSDLKLPGASGFDLLELTRDRWPATEVIVITGYATLENALTTFQEGAFDFVPKPFDVGELLGAVRRALQFSAVKKTATAGRAGGSPAETSDDSDTDSYFLGRHSWARLEPDGAATLGAAETFRHLLADANRIRLPEPKERVKQGSLLARILTPGEIRYRIWSPLSGIVLAGNPQAGQLIDLLNRDPAGQGWLIRIIPDSLDRELELLDRRRFRME